MWAANALDDEEDLDGDGEADVYQITPPELLKRKMLLIAMNVKEPDRIQSAIRSIYAALLAVLATLKLEFAQTAAIAMGIADIVKKPLLKFGTPALKSVLPVQAHHWIEPAIDSTMRLIAISAAMYLQRIISSFYSAIRGGKLVAEGLFNILVDKAKIGIVLCPNIVDEYYDPDDSILDDIIGFIIAFQGFMFQWKTGYTLTSPWNIILAPLSFVETLLSMQVAASMMQDGAEGGATRRLAELEANFSCVPLAMNATRTIGAPDLWSSYS